MYHELLGMFKGLIKQGAVTDRQQMNILMKDPDAHRLATKLRHWASDKLPDEFEPWADKKMKKLGGDFVPDYEDEDEYGDEYDESVDDESCDCPKDKLEEAWMNTIPYVGNPRDKSDTSKMTEDEIEMAELKRLAGME